MPRLAIARYRLARLLARWRRALLACCAALAVGAALLSWFPPPTPTVEVVVAARDLPATTALVPGDTTVIRMPEDLVPDGAVRAGDPPDGLALSGPMRRGEVLTTARVADPPAAVYGPDLVAAPVRVADAGAAALLGPGDRVDLLAAHAPMEFAAEVGGGRAAEVVAMDRPVIAVPEPAGTAESGGLILVAVSEDEARELAAHAVSEQISITIRG